MTACFARTGSGAGGIAEEFARVGVTCGPTRKADRNTGWLAIKRLLADAGSPISPVYTSSERANSGGRRRLTLHTMKSDEKTWIRRNRITQRMLAGMGHWLSSGPHILRRMADGVTLV
jgi:hypothetical protein